MSRVISTIVGGMPSNTNLEISDEPMWELACLR